jgi:putative transposase
MSILRQCGLLELARSTFYYQPLGESADNLALMRMIDEQFTKRPFYGVPRMTAWLRATGHLVNEKRVRRLMRRMGLETIYPKPRLSAKGADHKIYPYLLKDVTIDHPDQVWSTDITYVRLAHGFVFLVAIMDWYSRYVLSWELSTTLDKGFCLEALQRALRISKRRSSTPTRERSLRASSSRKSCSTQGSRSEWMVGAGRSTTFLWSGSGGR